MDLVSLIPDGWVNVLTAVIALASAVAALTSTPEEGTWKHTIYKFIVDLPAMNIGKAKE